MRTAVIGAGSWGTALALQLARGGRSVALWDHRAERAARMQSERQNHRYLPGIELPSEIRVTGGLADALNGADVILSVLPSQVMRAVMERAAPHIPSRALVCTASKGIEVDTLHTMDEVLRDVLPEALHGQFCHLAGPSFAKEVALDMPTAVVVAGRSTEATHRLANVLHHGSLRVYHTDDIVGAEYGGALKNIIAIACGIADGLGLGLNARAALITRGLAEITRLAIHRGGNPMTLAGLAGFGDLVLTCTGDLSRNRRVGLGLGQGKTLEQILKELGQVAEGVMTTRSAHQLAEKTGVQLPITEQIYQMLYEDKPPAEALADLMGRQRRAERG